MYILTGKEKNIFPHIKRNRELTANSGRFFSRFSSPPSKIVARDVRRTLENTSSCWHAVETLVISPWYPASDISYRKIIKKWINKSLNTYYYLRWYFRYPNKPRRTHTLAGIHIHHLEYKNGNQWISEVKCCTVCTCSSHRNQELFTWIIPPI